MTSTPYEPQPAQQPQRPSEAVAGLLAAAAIFLGALAAMDFSLTISGVELAFAPIRVGVPAVGAALLAAAIGGRHGRLATFSVHFSTLCFFVGMVVAVVTGHALY